MSALVDVPIPTPTPLVEPSTESVPETSTATQVEEEAPAMSEHTYKYKVKMTCGGCSGAVTKVLDKAKREGAGVEDFTVTLETQEVVVHGSIPFEDLTARIAKTGKEILEKEEVAS